MIWEVNGYWKDDKSEFTGYLITDESPENVNDDEIFYYVNHEESIKSFMSKDGPAEFVITSYKVVNEH